MNGYDLHRMRLNFRFENPDKCRSIHSELFMYIVDLWNRLGQKEKFGLPTQMTMEFLGIGSYNTYNKAYTDLVEWGFIEEVKKSVNQYSARVIAISKSDKATDKALDKATIKATDKAPDIIDNNITNKQITKEQVIEPQKKTNKTSPTITEVEQYFTTNGYSAEVARRAWNYYDVADWHDSNGKKVKNWKQKMQSVWFKDENKIKTSLKTLTQEEIDERTR